MNNLPGEPYWSLLLIVAGVFYLGGLERIRRGLARLGSPTKAGPATEPLVSVIIPCRNEAEHIGPALEDLAAQDYPKDRLQVIIVDDRSEDETGDLARRHSSKFKDLIVLRIESCPRTFRPRNTRWPQGWRWLGERFLSRPTGIAVFLRGGFDHWLRNLLRTRGWWPD